METFEEGLKELEGSGYEDMYIHYVNVLKMSPHDALKKVYNEDTLRNLFAVVAIVVTIALVIIFA